jgi:hypothetical protein
VGPRQTLIVKVWRPAPDGASWDKINNSWVVLLELLDIAEKEEKCHQS